jgi:hypothetical protein
MPLKISSVLHHMSFKLTHFCIRLSVFWYSADISVSWYLYRFTVSKMLCLHCIFQLSRHGTPWFVNLMHSAQLVIPTTSGFSTLCVKILQNTWKIYMCATWQSRTASACMFVSSMYVAVFFCIVKWAARKSYMCSKVIKRHQGVQSWLNLNLFLSGISSSAKNT